MSNWFNWFSGKDAQRKPMGRVCLLVTLVGLAVWAFDAKEESNQPQRWSYESERSHLPRIGLPIEGTPRYIVSLHPNDETHWYPGSPKLAVLYEDISTSNVKLVIFRAWDDKLVPQFSYEMKRRFSHEFIELEPFHSYFLSGIVIWRSDPERHIRCEVICYANGKFRVVFQGVGVDIIDLDSDAIPEMVSKGRNGSFEPDPTTNTEGPFVYAWDGSEFVLATRLKNWGERYSKRIIDAVTEIRNKRPIPGQKPPTPRK